MLDERDDAVARFKTKPLEHQLRGLRLANGRAAFAYLCEQGTGKTWILINEAAQLWGEGKVDGVLVFAPNGVHSNWVVNELPKHMPDWVRWRAAEWRANAKVAEREALEALLGPDPEGEGNELRLLAMNWDALQTKRGVEFATRFARSCGRLMIVLDESHKMKNPSTARAKALEKLRLQAKYRRIATGTPILNAPFDAFAQFRFLDPMILRTTSFPVFKAEYAEMMPGDSPMLMRLVKKHDMRRAPQIVERDENGQPKYRNLEKLARLIAPHSFRVLKKDCLDLPEKVYTQSYFDLTPKQWQAYRLMRDKARMVCESGSESATTKLVALGKLSQVVSGFANSLETEQLVRIVEDDENPKLALLRERLDDSIEQGRSVIVWCRYRPEVAQIEALCKQESWPAVTYFGGTSEDDRIKAMADFEAGRARVFIATNAGSTGLTLVAASHVIYYSNSFSLGDRLQSEDRAHRIGQTESVLYEDLICRGTVDEKIVAALRQKQDVANTITGDKSRNWLLSDEEVRL